MASSRVWLLVEWVDEKDDLVPSYDIVKADVKDYDETDLDPGNVILVRTKNRSDLRRAKIMLISESKRFIKENRDILLQKNRQVTNVLHVCIRTIKDMNAWDAFSPLQLPRNQRQRLWPQLLFSQNDNDIKINGSFNENNSKRRSTINGTPPRNNSAQKQKKICFDKETQTEEEYIPPSALARLEEMEAFSKILYREFQHIMSKYNVNEDLSYPLNNLFDEESWVEPNNNQIEQNDYPQQVPDEELVVENGLQQLNISNDQATDQAEDLRVRKMSTNSTTSNDIDLVPIGNGNVKVPARLLNDIDWNSYTSATRQLLQAVFPRWVLATHSLTGKQSAAFLNRPPKRILEPKLIEDIVRTVSIKCGVPKSLVRKTITIKCTDEAKLYRNRQQYNQNRNPLRQIDENVQPPAPLADELSAAINK